MIPFSAKLNYGVGQAADGMQNGAFGAFVVFYYNQVLGLPGALAGLAVGIALIVDALTDPLAGSISDNWRSAAGRRHPFMLASVLPLCLAFFLLFSPPPLEQTSLFIWLTVFAVATRTAMTFFIVPYTALGAELSRDFEERTMVVGFRMFFSNLGAIATFAFAFGIYFASSPGGVSGQLDQDSYPRFAGLLAVLMAGAMLWSSVGTRTYGLRMIGEQTNRTSPAQTLRRMVVETVAALGNYSFRWLLIGVLIAFLMVGVDGALNLHMNTFFWELDSSALTMFFVATPIGLMFGSTVTHLFHRRFDKRLVLAWGTVFWAAGQIVPVVLRLVGWFPENGSSLLSGTLISVKFAQGLGMAQAAVTFGSMVADIADEHELATGRRSEGVFFAAVSFSNKFTTGIGSIIAGVSLDIIDWPRGSAITTAAQIPPETIVKLGVVYGPIVAGFGLFAVWCYLRYNLTRRRHAEILVALDRKAETTVCAP